MGKQNKKFRENEEKEARQTIEETWNTRKQ